MPPRTILYTGKGGVGKTSVAAATARRCAAQGLRTLVLSTDPAHSLSDSLEVALDGEPTPVAELLWGQEVQAQAEMERHWSAVRAWLGQLLVGRGVDRVSAEELTVPPGLDELFSLLQVKAHYESGEFDALIVDCAPTGETLRLLSFPDVARWWLERVFPQHGRIMDAARPFARAVLDISLPDDAVLDDVGALIRNLIAMNEILRDHEHVSIRLVMSPDRMVLDEARRTFTYLNLYGFLTDAVVVNRVFGAETGAYFGAWRERQLEHLRVAHDSFAPVPVLQAPWFEEEVVGATMLDRLGDTLFAEHDPAGVLHQAVSQKLTVGRDSATWRVELPLAQRGEISVKKIGLELVVRVDGHKRAVLLPPALADYAPAGASFRDGTLEVRFDGPREATQ
ncbi:MAG: arsenite/tail-anchored protein-transporting ATPase [Solirubrobacteraceae bacterium]|jgi:arsenite-transporting ATPase|nr:arsenite/tail-anchored protein-transporting ATPase [Solirubrobacteraceae bacterium]